MSLFAKAAIAQTEVAHEATFKDISYGTHERHKLDVDQAKADAVTLLVIFIHGGGWAGGDKKGCASHLAQLHAREGRVRGLDQITLQHHHSASCARA